MDDRSVAARPMRISGSVFAVLFVGGLLLLANWPLQLSFPDQRWVAWYEDGGNRARQLVGCGFVVASALAFVIFVAGFVQLTEETRGQGLQSRVALAAGVLFAAMAMLGALTLAAVSAVVTFGGDGSAIPNAEVMRFLDQAGLHGILGLAGGWSAAICVTALMLRARCCSLVPPWLTMLGFGVAVLLLAGPAVLPLLLLPLWTLACVVWVNARPR